MTCLVRALLLAATVVTVASAAANRQPIQRDPNVCRGEHDSAGAATNDSKGPGTSAIRRDIDRAYALFRFHRVDEARVVAEAIDRRFERSPDLLAPDDRSEFQAALKAFRSCLSSATPSAMATLTVRTNYVGESGGRLTEHSAGEGVYIRVDGMPVGRTLPAGTLTAQVPSGPVIVTAIVPPTSVGHTSVALPPDGAGWAAITLDDDKEVTDETDLVLVEALEGVLPADARSLTLQFLEDARPIAVTQIQAIELLDDADGVTRSVKTLFAVSGTSIVAVNSRAVLDIVSADTSAPIRLRVEASDAAGFIHSNIVEFRIQR